MVYQEDVLKVCHHFAGLDLADADVLRRAMSGKFRSKAEFQRIVEKFLENCGTAGYPEELTQEVWRQIEVLCRLFFFESPFGFVCRGKFPEPLPESSLIRSSSWWP